ncbi:MULTISPECIES: 2OG-Fe dioxygenase family protein [unclassified Janthinobacterium]|uniref:2OG-Fe dioxygenase family protein n=1 Tax=unclassified Janthinobacterium TaxID=2610881 RepID=UPI0025AED206|nr:MULTISPECIES: 2OG-Fe dioxygenase family protein [unclassified Janthinobacterium]MDN2716065.1 2OG-Fe dioxygenase family protein [Janthinobacterium sp. SUN120]MDO8048113.1 2OG-Fe dioxygenase family protein [Janthinobacterium sp. SUN211]
MSTSAPIFTDPSHVKEALRDDGYAVLRPQDVAALAGCPLAALRALEGSWNTLPLDNYLKDGGRYRRRRHSCFVQDGERLTQTAHRPHWQPVEYNALHGGMHRLFEPVEAAIVAQAAWQHLIRALGDACSQVKGSQPWFIEAHQFRIDTTDGIGRPTPEGAHRDGVDFVAVLLIGREQVKGGETRIFEADGPNGKRFTLTEPWSLLLLDDASVIHESTPIQPIGEHGHRDTLVLTYRAGQFQGEN